MLSSRNGVSVSATSSTAHRAARTAACDPSIPTTTDFGGHISNICTPVLSTFQKPLSRKVLRRLLPGGMRHDHRPAGGLNGLRPCRTGRVFYMHQRERFAAHRRLVRSPADNGVGRQRSVDADADAVMLGEHLTSLRQ